MVIWSDEVLGDLEAIATFISDRSSSDAARRIVQQLYQRGRQLDVFPSSGRIVPDWQIPGVRELIEPPYRIIYRLVGSDVEIIAVYHSARSLEP